MKLLIITPRFPFPIEKGDKLRVYNQIKYLSRHHQIILVALSDQPIKPEEKAELKKYCDQIYIEYLSKFQIIWQVLQGFLLGLPIQVSYFFNRRLKEKIHALILQENPDHIYCQLIRVAEYVRHLPYPKSIDLMDCFSLSTRRRAMKSNWLAKWFFHWETKKVTQYEKDVFFDFDHHFIISDHDKEAFSFHSKSLMHVVPNGLDQDLFQPIKNFEAKFELVFVGNMGYYPNVQAAIYLVLEILPLLPKNINVMIAGARPDKRVKRLASARVTVSGWVPDIREAYQSGQIFIAPLFEGAGLQNKVLEAMALEVPCIISPVVNNALQAIEGKHVLLGHDASTFADQIINLLGDKSLRKQLVHNSKEFVRNQYNWDLFNAKIHEVIISEYDAFNRKRATDYAQ